MSDGLTVGELREAIIAACDLGGAYGQNLSETKQVLIRTAEDTYLPLSRVCVKFHAGRFALVLDAVGGTNDKKGHVK
jgi:hypothetical protein